MKRLIAFVCAILLLVVTIRFLKQPIAYSYDHTGIVIDRRYKPAGHQTTEDFIVVVKDIDTNKQYETHNYNLYLTLDRGYKIRYTVVTKRSRNRVIRDVKIISK